MSKSLIMSGLCGRNAVLAASESGTLDKVRALFAAREPRCRNRHPRERRGNSRKSARVPLALEVRALAAAVRAVGAEGAALLAAVRALRSAGVALGAEVQALAKAVAAVAAKVCALASAVAALGAQVVSGFSRHTAVLRKEGRLVKRRGE